MDTKDRVARDLQFLEEFAKSQYYIGDGLSALECATTIRQLDKIRKSYEFQCNLIENLIKEMESTQTYEDKQRIGILRIIQEGTQEYENKASALNL